MKLEIEYYFPKTRKIKK